MAIRVGISYVGNGRSYQNYVEAVLAAGAEPVILATEETCPEWPSPDEAARIFAPGYAAK